MPDTVLIVANKAWEADPLIGVLTNGRARPAEFPASLPPPKVTVPRLDGQTREVAARALLRGSKGEAEVWCLADLMDKAVTASSSQEKARVLPALIAGRPAPSLVIAFGTAAFPGAATQNGSVVVGANAFVNNPYAGGQPNPESNWLHADFGKLVASPAHPAILALDRDQRANAESRFLPIPLNPVTPPILFASADYVALSGVNVTNPVNYAWADAHGIAAIGAAGIRNEIGSVETTHGVIRLMLPSARFIFVTGIANRLGAFGTEVAPRSYAQNFVASHNAGIGLAWMLPQIIGV